MSWLIPLHRRGGEVVAYVIIDEADAEWAAQWRWCLNSNGYVWRTQKGRPRHVYLHRELAGGTANDGLYADHINRNRLDCRRTNLRLVTPAQSAQNKPSLKGRYRGVCWDRHRGKWRASAQLNGHAHHLGRFDSEDEAARAVTAWRLVHMPFTVEGI